MKKIKCECPLEGNVSPSMVDMYSEEEKAGMYHKPNKCKGTHNLKKFRRGKKKLWLCSCCTLPGDIEIKKKEKQK